jgi:hypothetical protein
MRHRFRHILFTGFCILLQAAWSNSAFGQQFTLSGNIMDALSGEMIIGATIYDQPSGQGTATNTYGFYSLTLPAGEYIFTVRLLGYQTITDTIRLTGNVVRDYRLSTTAVQLQEVVVESGSEDEAEEDASSPRMGMTRIPLRLLASVPAIGGEADVVKLVQLMPGVVQGVEGSTGMYVRGGDGDQNLILLDEAVVYNVSHLFGFFSVFNPETLRNVTLHKGSFPASYGGRLSSVVDIRMKEGNNRKFTAEGGIGLLSSRVTVQGPIIKDRFSFMIAGRRTYVDQVARAAGRTVPYYFYDLNAKANFRISDKDRLFYSTYFGNDVLSIATTRRDSSRGTDNVLDFGFTSGNYTNTLRWNHLHTQKLFANISLIQTHFRYNVQGQFAGSALLAQSSISDVGLKADYSYYRNTGNLTGFGGSVVRHAFRPNLVNTSGNITEFVVSQSGKLLSTFESALYYFQERQFGSPFRLNYGLRLSMANVRARNYSGIEPRLAVSYALPGNQALKLGFSRMKQYMHLLSSSSFSLPTDLWYPVTDSIKPQTADQVALGYNRRFEKFKTALTAEVYYKRMRNLIEYRPGAQLLLNNNYADELITGRGNAWGLELLLQKNAGRLSGWLSYTLSWTRRQFAELNEGKPYYARYDRRHNVALVGSFDLSPRITFSATWVFLSGARFTPPVGQYIIPNTGLSGVDVLPVYTTRNSVQLPSSHRLDVNLIIRRKAARKWSGEWHLGAYNVYNRAQPFRIDVAKDKNGNYQYQALGLFGFIPSVAYNFKF